MMDHYVNKVGLSSQRECCHLQQISFFVKVWLQENWDYYLLWIASKFFQTEAPLIKPDGISNEYNEYQVVYQIITRTEQESIMFKSLSHVNNKDITTLPSLILQR